MVLVFIVYPEAEPVEAVSTDTGFDRLSLRKAQSPESAERCLSINKIYHCDKP
jgi:hypothetical protein